MQRLHARETSSPGRYIRLLSIIPYYLPRALVAISSFRTTRNDPEREQLFLSLCSFFPPPRSPLSLLPFIIAPVSRALDRRRSIPPASRRVWITVRIGAISHGENYSRSVTCALSLFFFAPHYRELFARFVHVPSEQSIVARVRASSLISILSVRLAYCLFVKLCTASCSVRFVNE